MSGKNRFLLGFVVVTLLLAMVRLCCPRVAESRVATLPAKDSVAVDSSVSAGKCSASDESVNEMESSALADTARQDGSSIFFDKEGKEVKHRIFSVPHFGKPSQTNRMCRSWQPTSMVCRPSKIVMRLSTARVGWCMWGAILSSTSIS